MMLGTPARMKQRDNPMTPSPVILPPPVLHALNTTSSESSFNCRISAALSAPSSVSPDGAKIIAPGMPEPWKSSRSQWADKWTMRVFSILSKMATFVAFSPVIASVPKVAAMASAASFALGIWQSL